MEEDFIIFSVNLPICLHLDGRIFQLPYKKGRSIEITIHNFFSNKYSTGGSATNMEADSDTFSQYRFSNLQMKIPHFDNQIVELLEINSNYEKIFFKYYNRFIDSFRLITGRNKIRNIWNLSEFLPPLDITASKNINPEEFHSIEFVMGNDSLVSLKPLRNEKEHNDLEKSLLQELPLSEQFLNDAKRALQFFDLIHCNINAVIALEISVSYYISKFAKEKGVDKESIEGFIKKVEITGNIKTTLKLITPEDIVLPSDKVLSQCKAAITNRNKIVHTGLRDIDSNMLVEQMKAIEEVINFCNISRT